MQPELTRRTIALTFLPWLCCACATLQKEMPAEATNQEYRLGPGDQLRITVFGEADLTGHFVVGAHGTISYPLVGDLAVAGKTVPEFVEMLTSVLQHGYVRQPNVSAEVENYRPFYILGEVQHPGTYPFSANLTVMDAVATAQGFTYRADTHRVFIKHAEEDEEKIYQLTSRTRVQPGDTVRIPERRF